RQPGQAFERRTLRCRGLVSVRRAQCPGGRGVTMATHADVTRKLFEAFNANRPEDAADLITDDFLDHHVPAEIPRGLEGLRMWWAIVHGAFEARIDFDDVIEGDGRVASRWTFSGTHIGEFNGIPASNAKVSAEFMSIDRFEVGRIAERWEVGDLLGLLQQMGAIPA